MSQNDDKVFLFSRSEFLDSIKSRFFLTGVLLGLVIWVLDPFVDAVFLQEGTIYQQLTQPTTSEIYFRSVFLILIIIFSFTGSFLLNRARQAEERTARFSRIFEDSLNEIYLFDADSLKFVQVNSAAQHNLGYTMEELQELTPLDLKPEFTAESFAELSSSSVVILDNMQIWSNP